MKKNKKRPVKRFWLLLLSLVLVGFVIISAVAVFSIAIFIKNLPSPSQFNTKQVSQSTKIFDRTGEILLYEVHGEEKRTVVPFDEIPDFLKKATLAAEDANFYNEPAFDWKAIVRAFLTNLKEGRIAQGGSTITQQLAKNVFLTSERTFVRKLKELILAVQLESHYSKDEIFSLYLNQIPYGSNAYGVEAASLTYFSKSVKDLTLGESAIIASLTKAPSYYSPWGTHKDELISRKDKTLDRMAELGYISPSEKESAKKEKLNFSPPSIGSIKAPHFSLAVKDYLVGLYGESAVLNGGLKVITTLDWEMQQTAEKSIAEGAKRNEELYKGKNAALVAEDPKTGQILALVGSRDYFDVEGEGNFNVAMQGLRQPGSALKPFAYLKAFEKGYSPKTILFDVPTEFDTTKDPEKSYQPKNYDEHFRGPIKMEEALAQSINVPSVKTLYLAKLDDFLKLVQDFGITTLKERWRYGLSLILGGGEVKLYDLVNTYATLSQEGVKHEQSLILKIEDRDGKTIESYHDKTTKVMEPQYPRLINRILSDKDLRSPLFENSLSLTVFPDRDVALKTGTTNDYRDAWALGYSPNLVVGVWAGNNDNAPMQRRGGSILAAVPIWSDFLKESLKKFPPELFNRPDQVTQTTKPLLNGEAFFRPVVNGRSLPQVHSILYYVDPKDPLGPEPDHPEENPQFENWEKGVIDWAKINLPNFYEYNQPLPNVSFSENSVFNQNNSITFGSYSPANGTFLKGSLTVRAEVRSVKNLSKIEAYFNRKLVNSFFVQGNSYNYQYYLNDPLSPQNLFEIKAFDVDGNSSSLQIIFFRQN